MVSGRRPGQRMRAADRAAVVAGLRRGLTHRAVAELVGASQRTVWTIAQESGGMRSQWKDRAPRHLSLVEREEIRAGLAVGESLRVIAARLGRSPSTICREVRRNGGRDRYLAWKADRRAEAQARRPKPAKLAVNARLREVVEAWLQQRWSPQQIAARLKIEFPDEPEMWVSHETIYQSLFVQSRGALRKELTQCLRTGRARRRPMRRSAVTKQRSAIPDMVTISERPADIEDRAVPGHWEGDLIMGRNNRSAVATLAERSTRFVMLVALENQTAEHVADRLATHITTLPAQLRRSLTWDQGKELYHHQQLAIAADIDIYFCDPHSPWQRGTNENINGLLRQYLPKGTDLSTHSQTELDTIAAELNGRPRQTLDWMKPSEKFNELVATTS